MNIRLEFDELVDAIRQSAFGPGINQNLLLQKLNTIIANKQNIAPTGKFSDEEIEGFLTNPSVSSLALVLRQLVEQERASQRRINTLDDRTVSQVRLGGHS